MGWGNRYTSTCSRVSEVPRESFAAITELRLKQLQKVPFGQKFRFSTPTHRKVVQRKIRKILMKNIGWYTRAGHLDFLARLSRKLKARGNNITCHYVCHNRAEEKRLRDEYGITPLNLGDYLDARKSSLNCTEAKIRKLETKYDIIPLRRLLWSEMHEKHFSEERMIFHLIAHFEFWEGFLKENKIDGIVSERPSILSTSVLWVVCQKLNVRFLDFINIGIDGRIVFSTSWYGDIDSFKETFETVEIDKESKIFMKSISYLKRMKTQPSKPEYISKNLVTGKKITGNQLYQQFPRIGPISQLQRRIRTIFDARTYYITQSITQYFLSLLGVYLRVGVHRFVKVFENNIDSIKERFFLFPLHMLHEWSDYPWMGLKYPNMTTLIEEIASCIPLGCKLYVKEHTTNFPEKSFSFYRSIKKIPQVKLIDRHEDTYKLITNSEGIITLGGTMGWEAMIFGRPVIILGEAWYKVLPGIFQAKSNEHLVELLQDIKTLPLATDDEKIRAIYSLFKLSFKAERYPVVDLITPENIERYIEPFEVWFRDKVGAGKQMTHDQKL